MTAEKYVNQVIRKIKCGKEKRKDIRLQLIAEINERVSDGELLDDVIISMGSVEEVAQSFNESLSEKEFKKYRKGKVLKVIGIVTVVLAVLFLAVSFLLPVSRPIESSKVFSKQLVTEMTFKTINLLDAEDYEALKNMSVENMKPVMTHATFDGVKEGISKDWGSQVAVGNIYMVEVSQMGRKMAVTQVQVAYENTSVIYTVTFDQDMNLAGLFMK